ncbi:hypothetical protein LEP1GSC044_3610 [Leptospira kirschneri serovar Grippotyphosa str. RM52]|uniref:Uncharacterized protein n=1 Tax=Leptospira kirschneri str. 200802841 TaxID=1193047 RepID=A0A828Y3G3_9LEPT|nr:hypothetical protein LEP1GSC044_3610 [Leptospira kirschneri serovar Grippotyphosa str. RM52]EKO52273.1 hypothetical protein LEP1GSC131_3558 [Leptospira kirschneri str. 200802841]EKR06817.1 hypothetical protein LEP1GSC122_1041 [Leptospira kirschneri serovar Valbuzzi str. 200702274]EMN05380.1 hypothetical protein LEP1GSC046_2054 [Leptospira kirschneri serovar Bim str. 1051]EMO82047.1 hypothetical protein LEP1GSC126_4147 [Leptospira kirschneri str. 200801774]
MVFYFWIYSIKSSFMEAKSLNKICFYKNRFKIKFFTIPQRLRKL